MDANPPGSVFGRPNFLILGAPKCGTTTLHEVLRRHPDAFLPPTKDPLFFEDDDEYRGGLSLYWDRYFRDQAGQKAIGEARPTKLLLGFVAERIRDLLPDAKLVAILRNPADRLFSHWWMRRCNGKEPLDLAEALRRNQEALRRGRRFDGPEGSAAWRAHVSEGSEAAPVYLDWGYYAEQLERYFALFPREQIRVLLFDDLRQRPGKTFCDLFSFLGIDDMPLPPRLVHNAAVPWFLAPLYDLDHRLGLSALVPRAIRVRSREILSRWARPPQLDEPTRRWLVEHYRPHNQKLESLLGRTLDGWM